MNSKTDAVAYHDALARGWEGRYGRGGFARRARFIERVIVPHLPAGGSWLDAGCGTGTFSRLLAQDGRSVTGVDASLSMVAEANRQAEASSGQMSFTLVDTIEKLPFEAASFDGAICFSVLEYLERPFAALEELSRVITPGGLLVCSVPHRSSALRAVQKIYRGLQPARIGREFGYLELSRFTTTPAEMKQAAEQQGLTLRTTVGFDPLLPSVVHPLLKPSLFYAIFEKPH